MTKPEREKLAKMLDSLAGLPERIRSSPTLEALSNPGMDRAAMARGAERAHALVWQYVAEILK